MDKDLVDLDLKKLIIENTAAHKEFMDKNTIKLE